MNVLADISIWILVLAFQMAWLFLPAGVANISASLSKRIDFLNIPIDVNSFGENKTVRGFFFGFIGCILVVILQRIASDNISFIKEYSFVNYSYMSSDLIVGFSFLSSFGALGGDLIKSYFKRKKGIAPGKPWFPFDQIDWIVGVNLSLLLFYPNYQYFNIAFKNNDASIVLSGWMLIFPLSVLVAIPVHKTVNMFAYKMGLQKNKE